MSRIYGKFWPPYCFIGIWIALLCIVMFFLPTSSHHVWASEPGITVEAENAYSTNMLPGNQAGSQYSGGNLLLLFTDQNAPEGGYVAEYHVAAPTSGVYQLDVTTSPPGENWTSPFDLKVNDKPYARVSDAVEYGSRVTDVVRHYHLPQIELQKGMNTLTFRVTERRTAPDQNYVFFFDDFTLTPVPRSVQSLDSAAPMNVFESNVDDRLSVHLTADTSQDTQVNYEVMDYWSQTVRKDTVTVPQGNRTADIVLSGLPRGQYTIKAGLSGSEPTTTSYFAVVVPYSERRSAVDSPFAMDTASSWLVNSGRMNDFASVVQLSGVKWVRDRLRWADVNPQPGQFDYLFYPDYVRALSGKGIQVLDVFHDSPAWTRDNGQSLPSDLMAAYRFGLDSANHFGSQVGAWEIWNEPDIGFTANNETADQYAAYAKAVSIGYHDGQTKPLISMGGYSMAPYDYADLVLKNEVLPYVDIYSVHGYSPYNEQQAVIPFSDNARLHRQLLNSAGGGDKRFWMTESGIPIPVSPPQELTAEQQRAQARYLVTSTVTALSQGVDKYFWFATPPYQEGANYFGMLSRNYAPYSSLAAEAAMTDTLGTAGYAGIVQGLPEGTAGYAFKDGERSNIVIWSANPAEITLPLEKNSTTLTDIMGRKQVLTSTDGTYKIQIGTDPIYVTVEGSLPATLVRVSQPSTLPQSSTGSLSSAQRVVIAQRYSPEARASSKVIGAYQLDSEQTNIVTVELYNLNPVEMNGTLQGVASGGWQLKNSSAEVSVPPFSKKTIDIEITAGPEVQPKIKSSIIFKGIFGGEQTTSCYALVQMKDMNRVYPKSIMVDGTLDDMKGLPFVDLSLDGRVMMDNYAGKEDLSGNIWYNWDENYFYLSAKIVDDTFSQPYSGGDIWRGDGIQFAMAQGAPGASREWYEFGIALTPQGPQTFRWSAPSGVSTGPVSDAVLQVKRDEQNKTTVYELAIPWKEIAPIHPGNGLFSLSALINDDDGNGRKGWIEWGSGIGLSKDPGLFRVSSFVPDTAPPDITIEGAAEGQSYTDSVTPVVTAKDPSGINGMEINLDGSRWEQGTAITGKGNHTLQVSATDRMGNTAVQSIHFAIYDSTVLHLTLAPAVYSDTTNLRALLTNRLGQPLSGEHVQFAVDGQPAGEAVTNDQGLAVLPYRVLIYHDGTASPYTLEVMATYAQNDTAYYRTSEDQANLTVSKEQSSIVFTGGDHFPTDKPITLSAQLSQQDDGEPGSLADVPVRMTVSRIEPNGKTEETVMPSISQTNELGIVHFSVTLPAGLYEVKVETVDNPRYEIAQAVSMIAVYDPNPVSWTANGWFAIQNPDPLLGSKAKKLHLNAKVQARSDGSSSGRIQIHAEPGEREANISPEWIVYDNNGVYVLGQMKDEQGKLYSVLIMIGRQVPKLQEKSTDHQIVSMKLWAGTRTDQQPIFTITDVPFVGSSTITLRSSNGSR